MLKRLIIRNVALIESAEIEPAEGLNVLSGETGAGKSVILESIDFVLGAKADKGMVRHGADSCTVTAEFTASPETDALLAEMDLEPEETLLLSRKLTADGRGSLRVNGCPVTAAMLRRITSRLVDVHGQSEHFFLLKESNQLLLLDSIAGAGVSEEKERVRRLLAERKGLLADLGRLGGDEGERSRRLDVLRFQIDEIERFGPKEGEEAELRALQTKYRNAERISGALSSARDCLLSDGGAADLLRTAHRGLVSVEKYEAACGPLSERLENASEELSDIAETLDDLMAELDIDEREAERVEERLDGLKALYKKYGGDFAAVTDFLNAAKEEYALLSESGERAEELTVQLQKTDEDLYAACVALTQARKAAAEEFTERVVAELKTLNIPSARFEVQFDGYTREDLSKATSEGLGGIRFLFSANAGEPLKELGKIISGGEMSRFMLAVKAQLSSLGGIGTYLFDEIDAGIGGMTARSIAEKFAKIAKNVQLIAVTHLARVAAFADRQFLIEKQEFEGKTVTRIREVRGRDRVAEIARLIGGAESEHVVAHAEELLQEAEVYKNSLH